MVDDVSGVLDAVPMPLVLIAPGERVQTVNTRAEELFGRNLAGRHYIAALRAPTVLDCVEPVIVGRLARNTGIYLATEAGRDTTWRVLAVRVAVGGRDAVLVSFEDTTAVQEAGQIRRDFVANVSHELRTPLTALMGFIETLRGAARDDAAARDRFLATMEREAGRMNRIVRDLLSLSRVEAEERMRPTDAVDLCALIDGVATTLRPVADSAGVTLRLAAPEAAISVPGDSDQLAQVFTNLMENAIKYSGAGAEVVVTIEGPRHEPAVRGNAAIVTVADDGEGIDPVHIPRLTERFYRVDTHRSREMGGTGLGLAIVKHIVNRHRGRLRIDSAKGRGSQFSVILPAP